MLDLKALFKATTDASEALRKSLSQVDAELSKALNDLDDANSWPITRAQALDNVLSGIRSMAGNYEKSITDRLGGVIRPPEISHRNHIDVCALYGGAGAADADAMTWLLLPVIEERITSIIKTMPWGYGHEDGVTEEERAKLVSDAETRVNALRQTKEKIASALPTTGASQ